MRVTPARTTAVFRDAAGAILFAKVRRRCRADAVREWRSWMTLQELGVAGPVGIAWGWDGDESVVVARRVPGRPADVLWHEAVLRGDVAGAMACLVPIGCAVQRLHAAGVVYRDLYWQHVYGDHLSKGMRPAFIDSERLTAVGHSDACGRRGGPRIGGNSRTRDLSTRLGRGAPHPRDRTRVVARRDDAARPARDHGPRRRVVREGCAAIGTAGRGRSWRRGRRWLRTSRRRCTGAPPASRPAPPDR